MASSGDLPRRDNQSNFGYYGRWTMDRFKEQCKANPRFEHQYEAVYETARYLLRDVPAPPTQPPVVIVAPTGAGKSGIISILPFALQANKVLVITPAKVISEQLKETFGGVPDIVSFYEKCGVIKNADVDNFIVPPRVINNSSEIRDRLGNLVIANAQRFSGNSAVSLTDTDDGVIPAYLRRFFETHDLCIVDEAHHFPAPTWEKICEEFRKPVVGISKKLIFLTATPYRKDDDGRHRFILGSSGRITYNCSQEKLIGKVIRRLHFREKRICIRNQVANDINELLQEQDFKEPRFKHQAMVIVTKKSEANEWSAHFNTTMNDAKFSTPIFGDSNQTKLTEAFSKGEYRVAIVCNLLKEGYDNPKVSVCVILRKIQSRVLFSQFIGRCMRINFSISREDTAKRPRTEVPKRRFIGPVTDRTEGIVLSYTQFKQREMWETRNELASQYPTHVPDDDDS